MSLSSAARPGGRAGRWAGQRERRRQEFIEAALRAITKHGPVISVEQIAAEAGVARVQLYKHFKDAGELHCAVATRITELVSAELDLWELRGTAIDMIRATVEAHASWLTRNPRLYQYLSVHAMFTPERTQGALADAKTVIARDLAVVIGQYLEVLECDTKLAEPAAFGVVGLVDFCTSQWLVNPQGMALDELTALLTRWVWQIFDDMLRGQGVVLDPDTPLPTPRRPAPRTDDGIAAEGG